MKEVWNAWQTLKSSVSREEARVDANGKDGRISFAHEKLLSVSAGIVKRRASKSHLRNDA